MCYKKTIAHILHGIFSHLVFVGCKYHLILFGTFQGGIELYSDKVWHAIVLDNVGFFSSTLSYSLEKSMNITFLFQKLNCMLIYYIDRCEIKLDKSIVNYHIHSIGVCYLPKIVLHTHYFFVLTMIRNNFDNKFMEKNQQKQNTKRQVSPKLSHWFLILCTSFKTTQINVVTC